MKHLSRFEPHSHTYYSNLRLLDSINDPKDLVDRAIDLGLSGIAITDHECLSAAPELNIYEKEVQKEHPEFKIALGDEIYLVNERKPKIDYYHFILIAKNAQGHRALRELSSKAWMQSYFDRDMERVPTLYSELEDIVKRFPNSLIATSACLGGCLSKNILGYLNGYKTNNEQEVYEHKTNIVNFLTYCLNLFGEDFYIECAPGCSKEQIAVNKELRTIAKAYNIKMVIGTDAHFLKKDDLFALDAYLNSQKGERETKLFYEYAYLQDDEDIRKHLQRSDYDNDFIDTMYDNSMEIYDKIETYSLLHHQSIPSVEVPETPKKENEFPNYPVLNEMNNSDDIVDRYWINSCSKALKDKGIYNDIYLSRLEEEAEVKKTISEKLNTNMFKYPITLQHYIDLFWECGSTVGAGRGSSCSGLNHYLLGITQIDPVQWSLPFWRYLNKDRVELGDIDIDISPSKRPSILKAIKKERAHMFNNDIDDVSKNNLGCTLIATFGTETTKSVILSACRGYHTDEFPQGINVDDAQYISSLIPSERGFLWDINDVLYGNAEKDRKPVAAFINEVNKYEGLLDIIKRTNKVINKRSTHASGVILFEDDPYEHCAFMKAPNGDLETQFDLHMCEAMGLVKYDFLVTEIQDKILECLKLLQEDNKIDSSLTIRQVYEKYLHPDVLDIENEEVWNKIQQNNIVNLFQFDSVEGSQAIKKIKPQKMLELADANSLMRLMTSEKGAENPIDKYIRFKNNHPYLWKQEMKKYGLTEDEQRFVTPYFESCYGVPSSQESVMQMLMDENICHFTLKEANTARKIIGKKKMSEIPKLKEKVMTQALSSNLGRYVWDCGIGPQLG